MKSVKTVGIIVTIAASIFVMAFAPAASAGNGNGNAQSGVPVVSSDQNSTDRLLFTNAEGRQIEKSSDTASADDSFAMANIASEADVYTMPDRNSQTAGRIYSNTQAEVLSRKDGWTKIKTGNLTGFVPESQLMYGSEGRVLMNVKCPKTAVADGDAALYEAPDAESSVTGAASEGDAYAVAKVLSGWYEVTDGTFTYYLQQDAAHIDLQFRDGMTTDEIAAYEAAAAEAQAQAEAEAAAAEAAAAEAAAAAAAEAAAEENNGAVSAADNEEDLLAAILYCEAGANYEGDCAVGAVIMNRVRSASFPDTITDVIYAPGQFSPVSSGKLDRVLSSGVPDVCYEAAEAVLAGYSNVGDCLYFHAGSGGLYDIGGNTFR